MALRGETVGTAYVRILADGGGLPESIKHEMDSAEPEVADAGERHSEAYEKAWEKRSEKNETIEKSMVKKVEKALGSIAARSDLIGDGIEERLADHLRLGLEDGLNAEHADKIAKDAARRITEAFSRGGGFDLSESNIIRQIDASIEHITRESLPQMSRKVKEVDRNSRPFINTLDRVAHGLGSAFGRGARNNFVNMVGVVVGGLAQMSVGFVKLIFWVKDLAQKQTKVLGNLEGTAAAATEASAEVAATGVPGWIALASLIGGIVYLAPIAAGALSSLAAGVTALASSVSFALVGGLGAIAGLLPVIAFGAATVGAAFIGMSDDAKKALKESIKPITDEFKKIQEAAQQGTKKGGGIFGGLAEGAGGIKGVMAATLPLIRLVSDAIGDVIANFATAANSPGFKSFIKTMSGFIPDAIRTLGRIATRVLGGLGGVFEGLIPIARRFLGWVDRLAEKFNNWANSAKGKSSIKDFMDKAGESASHLWDLITKVGEALGLLLFNDQGKKAGDSLIVELTDKVQEFVDYLKKNPDALRKWFGDGKQMIEDVGAAVQGLIDLFNALDTPENRKAATTIVRGIAVGMKLIAFAVGPAVGAMGLLAQGARGMNRVVRDQVARMADKFLGAVGVIVNGAAEAFGWVPTIGPKLRNAADKFNNFRAEVNAAIRDIDDVNVPVKITGGAKAIAEIADLQWAINKVPKEVTTMFIAKGQRILNNAMGGIVSSPSIRMVGEDGAEAIVPLNRPLAQVDPAVRALSAVAQGKSGVTTNNNGRSIDVGGLTIITPTKDPAAVAREAVNQLVASSYF